MRAAIITEHGTAVVVEEVTAGALRPNEVRVRLDASGVCHTDLAVAEGSLPMPLPMILGHEGAGTVLEVGANTTRVALGDVVIASFVGACGNCFFCLRQQSHLCERASGAAAMANGTRSDGTSVYAMTGLGTLAEEMTVAETALVKVDTDIPADQLALIGCGVTTGVGAAINTARIQPGSTVAVFGCGGVGQSVIQGARIAGAARIFAIDPVEFKRAAALACGATDVIDPAEGDPVEQVHQATAGRGVEYTFEVAGRIDTVVQAYHSARRGGVVVLVGMTGLTPTLPVPILELISDSKVLMGCMYGSAQVRRDFPMLVGLIEAGRLDVASMVTRHIHLDDINDAFQAMETGQVIRSVVIH